MFGFLAFLPRTIWILLQLLCLGFCLGIATNPTIAGNLLLLTFHHIITPAIIIFTTTAHILASAFSPTFAAAAEIWEAQVPGTLPWNPTTAAASPASLVALWKLFQKHQNKEAPYGNRHEESLFDLIETKFQPVIDNLDQAANSRNPYTLPNDVTNKTTTARTLVG